MPNYTIPTLMHYTKLHEYDTYSCYLTQDIGTSEEFMEAPGFYTKSWKDVSYAKSHGDCDYIFYFMTRYLHYTYGDHYYDNDIQKELYPYADLLIAMRDAETPNTINPFRAIYFLNNEQQETQGYGEVAEYCNCSYFSSNNMLYFRFHTRNVGWYEEFTQANWNSKLNNILKNIIDNNYINNKSEWAYRNRIVLVTNKIMYTFPQITKTYSNNTWSTNKTFYIKTKFTTNHTSLTNINTGNVVNYEPMLRDKYLLIKIII